MTGSIRELMLVLVYDHHADKALWAMPSEAARLEQALPTCEQIEELHPRYQEILALAGPRPCIMTQEVG